MVQKSGCNARRITTIVTMNKKGISHSFRSVISDFFLFKKYAKYIIIQSFKNSAGCNEKGINGIFIHHFAQLYVTQTNKTIKRNISVHPNICFEYFSILLYGFFAKKASTNIDIIT